MITAARHKSRETKGIRGSKNVADWALLSGVVTYVSGGRMRISYKGGLPSMPNMAGNFGRGL